MKTAKEYPRFVTPDFEPFDPVELAKETEKMSPEEALKDWNGNTRISTQQASTVA